MKKTMSFCTLLLTIAALSNAIAAPNQPSECIQSDLAGVWAVSTGGQVIKMKVSADGSAETTAINSFISEPYASMTTAPLTIGATPTSSCEFTGSFTVDYARQSFDKSQPAIIESNATLPVSGVLSADKMTMVISSTEIGTYPENSQCNTASYYCYTTGFDFSGTAVKVQ
ncbi:hypothetical protein MCAMS1_02117 [biofilm metagenome]